MRETLTIKKLNKEVNGKMRKFMLILALAALSVMALSSFAFANHSGDGAYPGFQGNPAYLYGLSSSVPAQDVVIKSYGAATQCIICHTTADTSYAGSSFNRNATRGTGPHGQYTTTTKRCTACHVLHSNVADNGRTAPVSKLLPGQTVTGVCAFCHDLTGSENSAYATYYLADLDEVKSAHRVEGQTAGAAMKFYQNDVATPNINAPTKDADYFTLPGNTIPGGTQGTGGTLAYANLFKEGDWSSNSAKQFTCDSCHTPHAVPGSTVAEYFGENPRKVGTATTAGSRLLKAKLTVTGSTYNQYGSRWCAGCHFGRLTMAGSNYNHPVNSSATDNGYNVGMIGLNTQGLTSTTFNVYANATDVNTVLAGYTVSAAAAYGIPGKYLITSNDGTASTSVANQIINPISSVRMFNVYPNFNSWYAMTSGDAANVAEPNKARPDGYIPISFFQSSTQGVNGPVCQQCHASTRNVEDSFAQNRTDEMHTSFPHIGLSAYLLVEQNTDDLCTNCHGLDNLP